ncbi:MAG: Imm53 family immunity protein [Chthonomonadales bacterium]
MISILTRLERWYADQCEEVNDTGTPWQHRYGLGINTSDNPAWNIGIELTGTALEGISIPQFIYENGDNDWYQCQIQNNQFSGIGDPFKLEVMLAWFFEIVDQHEGGVGRKGQ